MYFAVRKNQILIYELSVLLILMVDFHSSFNDIKYQAKGLVSLVENFEGRARFQSDSRCGREKLRALDGISVPRLGLLEVGLVIVMVDNWRYTKLRLESAILDSCKTNY